MGTTLLKLCLKELSSLEVKTARINSYCESIICKFINIQVRSIQTKIFKYHRIQ